MTEISDCSDVSEADISAIRETLEAQQQLLQALYYELEEERESSATAATEALSMILRLQVEKATLNMEANQYKRMAEEKISHAETSLAMLEEIFSQTEMEVASLEYQIQAYRYKILSMGCNDVGISECMSPENVLLGRNEMHAKETALPVKSNIRRLISLPPIVFKDYAQKRSFTERGKSIDPFLAEQNADQQSFAQSLDLLRKSGDFGSGNLEKTNWDKVRRLLKQVEKISNIKGIEGKTNVNADGGRFCSLLSQGSPKITAEQARDAPTADMNLVNCQNPSDGKVTFDSSNCLEIYDIFEVPKTEANEIDKPFEQQQRSENFDAESDDRMTILNLVSEPERSCEVHISDRLKKKTSNRKKRSTAFDKNTEYKCIGNNSPSLFSSGTPAEFQDELQKFYQRIEHLENEKDSTRRESSTSRDEELNLLKDIKQKLTSIETKMRKCKVKDSPPHDDWHPLPLQEAMLYFWM